MADLGACWGGEGDKGPEVGETHEEPQGSDLTLRVPPQALS